MDGERATWQQRAVGNGNRVTRPACVLVAEDDDDIRALVAAAMRKDGYDVVEVKDGVDLVERMGASLAPGKWSDAPDIIVSDVRMPGVSGMTVLASLRNVSCGTPMILITAYGNQQLYDQARSLGVRVFDKPFDIEDLRAAVLDALSRREVSA